MKYYVLNPDKTVTQVNDIFTCTTSREDSIVKKTKVGDQEVSTVFLPFDHNWTDEGAPHLFETMIFPECEYCDRCSTYEEALLMHEEAIRSLENGR